MAQTNLASARRKLALRGQLLQNRARIGDLQLRNKQLRAELTQHQPKRKSGDVLSIGKNRLAGRV
jgi:hypothetical protein